MDIQIIYSPFADSIKKQLKSKNLNFSKEEIKVIQELSFSVMNLHFHGTISDFESDELHAKIHKELVEHLERHNEK